MDKRFCVGFDRQEITPEESIPLSGFSNEPKRYHTEIKEPICISCVAITDCDDVTLLMISGDFMRVNDHIGEPGRKMISQATGIPEDKIIMAATHTHAAPGLVKEDWPCMQKYIKQLFEKLMLAVENALADRKPATMRIGSIETQCMNFVKHYKCKVRGKNEICYLGDLFGDPENSILLEHATQVDPTLHILQFPRAGGKDVVIANFRAHPHFDGGSKKYVLSADYPGAFRRALEEMVDCHAIYFQGACGNVNCKSRMPSELRHFSSQGYGLALAGYAAECMVRHTHPVAPGPIRTKQIRVCGAINHTMDHLLEQAKEIRQEFDTNFDLAKCIQMGKPYGIRSPYHAGAIIWNHGRTDEEDGWMTLNAVSIGEDYAFATFPGEMFDSVSVRMEENSPFTMTMMLGYCHHHVGYLPSAVAYKYTSYETDTTRFAPGTGEMIADAQISMLRELKMQSDKSGVTE